MPQETPPDRPDRAVPPGEPETPDEAISSEAISSEAGADEALSGEEAQIAAMLRAARVTDPMPADVTARLTGLIDELAADRAGATAAAATQSTVDQSTAGQGTPDQGDVLRTPPQQRADGTASRPADEPPERVAPVIDLAARRRRQRLGGLVAAAAMVVVAGVGIPAMIDSGRSGSDAGGDAASEASPSSAPDSAEKLTRGSGEAPPPAASQSDMVGPLGTVRVRADRAKRDLRPLIRPARVLSYSAFPDPECPVEVDEGARLLSVQVLEGGQASPGLVAVYRTDQGTRAELYRCDGDLIETITRPNAR